MPNIANSPSHSRAQPAQYPTTPKARQTPSARRPTAQRKTQSVSPQSQSAYASSSICSSPSARNVPLPPIEWLNQLQVPSDASLSSRPSSANSNSSSGSTSPSQQHQMTGVRVCPLQLIAAVASA